jgi:hypothetical protein
MEMSRAKQCDRCGKLYPLENQKRYTRIVVAQYEADYRYLGDATRRIGENDLDLCAECTALFNDFFNIKEKENA